jgi:16S rRNA (adenine1518-N6/adenine1519-N6)-dimethyltransferase
MVDSDCLTPALPSTYQLITKYQLRNVKALGQHFIINQSLTDKIAATVMIEGKVVVEIGPGPGCLTRSILANKPKALILIEKDARFSAIYTEFMRYYKQQITVLNTDCLAVDFAKFGNDVTVISNLPYNIGTAIYAHLITLCPNVSTMALMLQREVAERIVAKAETKSFGRLAALTQVTGECQKAFLVKPSAFMPPPKVMSMVIKYQRHAQVYQSVDLAKFQQMLALIFQCKRKKLSSLKGCLPNIDKLPLGILTKRPSALSLAELHQIYQCL